MLAFTDERGRVGVAFTDRLGGVSRPPYDELSLAVPTAPAGGRTVEELREEVAGNEARVLAALRVDGAVLRSMRQVHGSDVAYVGPGTVDHEPPTADALVTDRPGAVLSARAADCVPVLIGDPEAGVAAAVHAGRVGLLAGVVPAALGALRDRGARRVTAWVGPHVCGRCYEVPAALRDQVEAAVPGTAAETSWGTPSVDLGAGVRSQLLAVDGLQVEVVRHEPCTVEDDRFYSYRRQGDASGRQAGLVWVRP